MLCIRKTGRRLHSPAVDGLFGIADIEEGSAGGLIHNDFFDEGANDSPLGAAGILEFIEEPVVKVSIRYATWVPVDRIEGIGFCGALG